ncbi:PIN domain nuclease of toxin-antitoxin system [Pedobacter psychrotolerans]|uniref:PIN domain nuclease of toxin-antitoxin system n=1 Tax=Pedobacter psychrotolerans TaxID=1843235 RepID=A0A4V2S082_9SPHI|nr:type II toxin-antitoxin system VapC family toxin [Pedobacter psychrotolerans]TCO30626.1 PIN domain nuclease of toxin-antitoxin system [Pedobacter psychrotolerans]GGE68746.1 twitching motility protein PilT [Pedobacter psychrotolerans]
MHILIDTHIFISLINEDHRLEKSIISNIEDPKNDKFLSIASLWEIVIKTNIGKLTVTRDLEEMYSVIGDFNISVLNIQKHHLDSYLSLPLIHRDPFDRLIVAQALADKLTSITDDQHIRNYPNLKLLNT